MDTRLSGFILFAIICVSYMKAEAAMCGSKSQKFKGLCFSDSNCSSICEKEGFLFGKCKGLRMRCKCYKNCSNGGATEAGGASGSDSSGSYSDSGVGGRGSSSSHSDGGAGGRGSFNSYSDGSTSNHA